MTETTIEYLIGEKESDDSLGDYISGNCSLGLIEKNIFIYDPKRDVCFLLPCEDIKIVSYVKNSKTSLKLHCYNAEISIIDSFVVRAIKHYLAAFSDEENN